MGRQSSFCCALVPAYTCWPAAIKSCVLKENQDVCGDRIFSKLLLPSRLWKCSICSATSTWWSPKHLFGTGREIFTGNQHDMKMHFSAPYRPCLKVAVLSSSLWQMSSGTCFFVLCKLIDSSWYPMHMCILRIPSKSTNQCQAFEVFASQLEGELNILSAICSNNVSKNLLFWRGGKKGNKVGSKSNNNLWICFWIFFFCFQNIEVLLLKLILRSLPWAVLKYNANVIS